MTDSDFAAILNISTLIFHVLTFLSYYLFTLCNILLICLFMSFIHSFIGKT